MGPGARTVLYRPLVHNLRLVHPFPEAAHERQQRLGSLFAFRLRRKRPARELVVKPVSTSD